MRRLLAPIVIAFHVVRRFNAERLAQTAAALSFATLLGLVPMFAVGIGLLSHLPFAEGMNAALEKFLLANLLPEKAGAVIAKYVGQFAHRATRVTAVGLAALLLTAIMQMLTIEHAFNAIWNIKVKRPWIRRLTMHVIALVLGPLVFGGSLAAISFIAGISFGLVDEPSWVSAAFFRGLSFVFTAGLFALLYWGVPNKVVPRWHAVAGGVFAALGFMAMQRLFGDYVANFPAYAVVYGPFAAVPIFLAWLYLSWTIILVGALLVAELPGALRR
ncbi:MAG: YihY family inner membrane protein [Ignavibacteria bacterium]